MSLRVPFGWLLTAAAMPRKRRAAKGWTMSHGPADGRGTLEAGLYLVSVPIGNARDITLRALDVLGAAEVLAAEDTRSLRRLMEIHGVARAGRQILSYHDRSRSADRARLLGLLGEGRSVAYASEAGTPCVSDPGYALVAEAAAVGHAVRAVPGPSAFVAALTVAGLPTDRFLFAGFPPPARGARLTWMDGLGGAGATVAIYESPRRVHRTLGELSDRLGDRAAALCRELTKLHEEVIRGTLSEIAAAVEGREIKGEVVILLDRGPPRAAEVGDVRAALEAALREMTVKDAARAVSEETGMARREVYAMALAMKDGGRGADG